MAEGRANLVLGAIAFAGLIFHSAVWAADPVFPDNGALDRASIYFPTPELEVAAELGDSMVSKKIHSQRKWIEVAKDAVCDPPKTPGQFVFPAGAKIFFVKEDRGGFVYRTSNTQYKFWGSSVPSDIAFIFVQKDLPLAPQAIMYQAFSTVTVFNCPGLELVAKAGEDVGEPVLRKELIYTGVSKGVISLTYREFSNDMARPAFTQDLKFDLAEGDLIGFKGSRFKIISANNMEVRYRVVKPLD